MYIVKKGRRGRPKTFNLIDCSLPPGVVKPCDYLLYLYQQKVISLRMYEAGKLYQEKYDAIFYDAPKPSQQSVIDKIGMENFRKGRRSGVSNETRKDIKNFIQWQRLRKCLKAQIGEDIIFLDNILLYEPTSFPFFAERLPVEVKHLIQKGLYCIHLNIN